MKKNNIEAEINRIRLEFYEETKDMTPAEHTRWGNERGQKIAAQYGFTIGTPTSRIKTPVADEDYRTHAEGGKHYGCYIDNN